MSSHILAEVTDVCDEVALINHGKLLFYDTLDNITTRFSEGHSSVDASFAAPLPENVLNDKIATNPDVLKVERLDPRRVRLTFKGDLSGQARLLRQLTALDLELVTFVESKSALEEIYMNQIEKGD
jgi:ABC-2 type transport system ATP-binding protein